MEAFPHLRGVCISWQSRSSCLGAALMRLSQIRCQSMRLLAVSCAAIFGGCDQEMDSARQPRPDYEPSSEVLPQLSEGSQAASVIDASESAIFVDPRFSDVASFLGIEFQFHTDFTSGRFYLPEVMGGGVGCIDFDRNGFIDLFFPNGSHLLPKNSDDQPAPTNVFYRNRGTHFEEIAELAGLAHAGYGQGCAIADYDVDGFPDVYLANYGENVLYRNNGDGTFTETSSVTTKGQQIWSTSPAWVDLNDDGLVDLYVVNYLNVTRDNFRPCDYDGVIGYCGPGEFEALPDEVLLNLGNGEFREASSELGLVADNGKGLAVSALDFNHDLKPEIYVANDMTENFLFSQNDLFGSEPPPTSAYRNVARLSGCAVSESGLHEASMGVACADFDLDLLPDIFLTHFYQHKNTLYRNRGGLTFSDDSRRFRVVISSKDYLGFGVVPFDYDSNGATDLFIANGHVIGPNYPISLMPPQLIANVNGKYFEDVSERTGEYFRRPTLGRGAAGLDFDNDGDSDIAVSHLSHPVSLLRNETADVGGRVIGLILEDRYRNLPIGGRVVIESEDYKRVYPVVSGGSYLSSPDPRFLIPLPRLSGAQTTVTIYWPSGVISEYKDLKPGRYWYLREGYEPVSMQRFHKNT